MDNDLFYQNYCSSRLQKTIPSTKKKLLDVNFFNRHIVRKFLAEEARDASILEIGCGYGPLIAELQLHGFVNVLGIDMSLEMVDTARRLGIENVIFQDAITHLQTLPDRSQDLILAIDVIEHFDDETLCKVAQEVFRVLKPAGKFITHQPNGDSPFNGGIRYGDITHFRAFTKRSVEQLFTAFGFSKIVCYEDKPLNHKLSGFVRYILWEYTVRPIFNYINLVETGSQIPILSRNFISVCIK